MSEKCSKRLFGGQRLMLGSPCSNQATVTEEGNPWCKIHAPSYVKAKNEAREAKWKAERDAKEKAWKEHGARENRRDQCEAAVPVLLAALESCHRFIIRQTAHVGSMNAKELAEAEAWIERCSSISAGRWLGDVVTCDMDAVRAAIALAKECGK